jgi:ferredoxin-NADP reductase
MMAMDGKEQIVASQLAGDFVLPKDKKQKLAFIAGGIGITPFRSMLKYLIDNKEKRDVALFYSNKTASEIIYKEVFDEAKNKLDIKTFYTLTDAERIPAGWRGHKGHFDPETIKKEMPDFNERMFYISGPRSMVVAFQGVLKAMGLRKSQIKTDFFPGFV